ncbi:hypothetical protein FH972_022388 [Carpinus fangiana]|uniref:PIG-P domain-containing protein n=1 Tax=Carpinus fangiana TaxID=176857 RepID=A0A5N6KSG6_9ROSI|nr:hypothetical protein FH972_022388 [Carpinus fangiana]
MPPQSRGKVKLGSHSRSVPNFQAADLLRPSTEAHAIDKESDDSRTLDDETASHSSFERDFLSPPSADDESESDASAGAQVSSVSTARHRPPAVRSATQTSAQRPLYSHASRSQSHLGAAAFAPPFYNRPPTPLPPSPSLTSLLRPPFSAHTSRPTTPDSSDTEATGITNPSSTAATITASARNAPTVPRASPKVPTYEYYGFVLYLGSSLAFLMYLLWSYLPTPFLHKIGIYYYPDRWWSLAIPSWIVMGLIWIYVALAGYNTGHLTLEMSNLECLVDEASDVAIVDAEGKIVRTSRMKSKKVGQVQGQTPKKKKNESARESAAELDWRTLWNEGTDGVLDIPIGGAYLVDPSTFYRSRFSSLGSVLRPALYRDSLASVFVSPALATPFHVLPLERRSDNQRPHHRRLGVHLDVLAAIGSALHFAPADRLVRPGARIATIKLIRGVHKYCVLSTVAHQIRIGNVVLDDATAQDDDARVGSLERNVVDGANVLVDVDVQPTRARAVRVEEEHVAEAAVRQRGAEDGDVVARRPGGAEALDEVLFDAAGGGDNAGDVTVLDKVAQDLAQAGGNQIGCVAEEDGRARSRVGGVAPGDHAVDDADCFGDGGGLEACRGHGGYDGIEGGLVGGEGVEVQAVDLGSSIGHWGRRLEHCRGGGVGGIVRLHALLSSNRPRLCPRLCGRHCCTHTVSTVGAGRLHAGLV